MGDLTGKVAVITGAARGIGKGIAERMSANGASVVIADIDIDEAKQSAAMLPGPAIAVRHDVRDGASATTLAAKALEEYGHVNILVNNAGVGPKPGPIQRTTEEEYDRVMDTNAKGVFLTTKAFVEGMIHQKSGRIINISSIVGQSGFAMVSPYVASKFAVTGMTQSLAQELAPYDITVNSIHPGIIATDLHSAVVKQFAALQGQTEEEIWAWFKARIPLGRFQTATDMGEMAVFLASDRAKNITGAAFNVDGGWEMH
ncbi:MAG TPA: glucose 1-dehydrogenase [Burkholderiales bacterium]|nr:glucose 1-dehydrogenase [Burkholderiales bacterium]